MLIHGNARVLCCCIKTFAIYQEWCCRPPTSWTELSDQTDEIKGEALSSTRPFVTFTSAISSQLFGFGLLLTDCLSSCPQSFSSGRPSIDKGRRQWNTAAVGVQESVLAIEQRVIFLTNVTLELVSCYPEEPLYRICLDFWYLHW